MKITVIRKTQYEGNNIYILQFDTVFQYLFVYKDKVYMDYIIAEPPIFALIAYRLGFAGSPYNEQEIKQFSEALVGVCIISIDKLREEDEARRTANKKESVCHQDTMPASEER